MSGQQVAAQLQQQTEQLLRCIRDRDVEAALRLEFELYETFVKAIEDEDHYERCFAPWRDEMAALGRSFAQPLPQPRSARRIGFVVHNGAVLGHTEVLLRLLEARDRAAVDARIYVLDPSCPDLARRAQALGVAVDAFPQAGGARGVLPRLQALRVAFARNGDDTAVWLSTPVLASFTLAMRIAPVQVFSALRYHPVRLPEIDGYVTYGSWGESERVIHGQRWTVCPVPLALAPRVIDAGEVARLRARFPERVLLGTLARPEKIASPAFLECVARILERHPQCAFLWTGRARHAGIDAFLRGRGVAERSHFVGWIDTAPYAAALDVFLESFPLGCGITGYQAMAAGVPLLSYLDRDTVFGMRYWHEAQSREDLEGFPVLCARSPDEYVELASRLIAEPDWRARWAAREKQFHADEAASSARYAQRYFTTIQTFSARQARCNPS